MEKFKKVKKTETFFNEFYLMSIRRIFFIDSGSRSMWVKWNLGIYERNLLDTDYTKLISSSYNEIVKSYN